MTRNRISSSIDGASAHNSEANTNSSTDAVNRRTCP
jgi:hypothetical protein